MKDNNKRNIMEFWTRKRIPYVFDETLSLYQLVRLTIKYLNQVIEDQNELKDAIKEFIQMFDEDLEKTVVEILQKWKDDGSLKEIINEALFESKLDKVEFEKYKDELNENIDYLNKTIDNISVSVLDYGADPTGKDNSFNAFNKAIKDNENVFIPKGNYKIDGVIRINDDYKIRKLCGLDKNAVNLNFSDSGIIINKRWLTLCNFKIKGDSKGSGIRFENTSFVNISHVTATSFKIGFDMSDENNYNITIFMDNINAGYNMDYGVLIKAKDQRNNISIVNSYINKNGRPLVDDLNAPALTDRGHGLMVTGGYGIEIRNNVFEYNAGAGVYLSNLDRELHGAFLSANYYERNKLANLYVDNTSGNKFKKVISKGSYFSDAGHGLVENAKTEREVYIDFPEKILCPDEPKNLEGCAIENISKEQIGFELMMIDPSNILFMLNDMSFMRKTGAKNQIHNREGQDGVYLHANERVFSPYYMRARLKKGVKYKLEFNYKNLTQADTPNLLVGLYDGANQKVIKSLQIISDNQQRYYSLTYEPDTDVHIRPHISISSGGSGNMGMFIYNIRLIRE